MCVKITQCEKMFLTVYENKEDKTGFICHRFFSSETKQSTKIKGYLSRNYYGLICLICSGAVSGFYFPAKCVFSSPFTL